MPRPAGKKANKFLRDIAFKKAVENPSKTAADITKELETEYGEVVPVRTVSEWIRDAAQSKVVGKALKDLITEEVIKTSLREELNRTIAFKKHLYDEFLKYWERIPEREKAKAQTCLRLGELLMSFEDLQLRTLGLVENPDQKPKNNSAEVEKALEEKLGMIRDEPKPGE